MLTNCLGVTQPLVKGVSLISGGREGALEGGEEKRRPERGVREMTNQ